jgi:hypothetical protein
MDVHHVLKVIRQFAGDEGVNASISLVGVGFRQLAGALVDFGVSVRHSKKVAPVGAAWKM